jgi:dTDP-4-dehydrorhamnose 3,5-epimerase-like enzyme
MSAVHIERLRTHRDARGWVVEPLRPDELPRQRNAHLVLSRPGAVRGNHYHLRGTEYLTLVGPALVRLREEGEVRDVEVAADEIIRLVIPPGISHAVKGTGSEPTLLLAFNSAEHDPEAPDLVRDVLIEG